MNLRRLGSTVVLFLAALLAALAFAASGCGGGKTTTTTNAAGETVVTCTIRFAKTKFLLHAAIAAGAFYRYIYNPYRAGAFKKDAPGRKTALAKAAASALVALHELKVAGRDARCDGPALKKLADPINSVLNAINSLKELTSGGVGAIATAGAAFSRLRTESAAAGAPIKQP